MVKQSFHITVWQSPGQRLIVVKVIHRVERIYSWQIIICKYNHWYWTEEVLVLNIVTRVNKTNLMYNTLDAFWSCVHLLSFVCSALRKNTRTEDPFVYKYFNRVRYMQRFQHQRKECYRNEILSKYSPADICGMLLPQTSKYIF